MKFAFIAEHLSEFEVQACCQALEVSRSGYYAWIARPPSAQVQRRLELSEKINAAHAENRQVYGSPRICQALLSQGVAVCRNTVAKLMKQQGIRAKTKRRFVPRTTNSRHNHPIAPNRLERNFTSEKPDQVWLADISYIPTDEGWLYLAAIKDMATREIVGWSMADHLRTGLCIDALVMALQRHPPTPGLIHHSDRGVQYASEPYRAVLERHGLLQSMSRRGNCLDNAPMESMFAALKVEHVHHCRFATREAAKAAVFDYIEVFYNRQRLHSGIGYRTPAEARMVMEGITGLAA